MAADREPGCFDAFPYAERQNRWLWSKGRKLPGWYPSLDQIFPMVLCRVLPVAGVVRPAAFCRVFGRSAQPGRPAVWLGGYQASMVMDQVGWPIFRVERVFIPPESEYPFEEMLERLLEDGKKIARRLGVRIFQVAVMEMDDGQLPGFPAVCTPFGPLADSRLSAPLAECGFSLMTELGYYRLAVRNGGTAPANRHAAMGEGRPYCWEGDDTSTYLQLWAEHCAQDRSDIHFLVSRLHPLDPRLQHHMVPQDTLSRLRFLGGQESPAGFVSWYPDVYPQLLAGEASGPLVRLLLGNADPRAVTTAKVLKCLAPRAEESGREELLTAGLRWAVKEAITAHPNLNWVQAGPVSRTHQALINVLEGEGFASFGRLAILERNLSQFKG